MNWNLIKLKRNSIFNRLKNARPFHPQYCLILHFSLYKLSVNEAFIEFPFWCSLNRMKFPTEKWFFGNEPYALWKKRAAKNWIKCRKLVENVKCHCSVWFGFGNDVRHVERRFFIMNWTRQRASSSSSSSSSFRILMLLLCIWCKSKEHLINQTVHSYLATAFTTLLCLYDVS